MSYADAAASRTKSKNDNQGNTGRYFNPKMIWCRAMGFDTELLVNALHRVSLFHAAYKLQILERLLPWKLMMRRLEMVR